MSNDSASPIRLLVVVNVTRPDLGGGVLFSDLFEGLAERGIDVTVKCAYSYYPEWTDKSGDNGFQIARSIESNVNIERHGLFIPRNPNSLVQRLIYEASFFLSLRRRLPKPGDFDAVMVFCPLIGSVAYAAAVKRRLGIPMWLNVQDLSAQAASAGGITEANVIKDTLLHIQNSLFARADIWTSISNPMMRVLQEHNRSGVPIKYAPNWLHPTLAGLIESALNDKTPRAIQTSASARGRSNGSGSGSGLKLFYSGNIGTKQNLLTFCKALAAIEAPFSFRIQGAGGRKDEVEQWIASSGDSRFELLPLSDEETLARLLVECDFYVITERPQSGNSFIPSKLIPAIASQTPILAVCDVDSPLGEEMSEHGLGPILGWDSLSFDQLLGPSATTTSSYHEWKANCSHRAPFYDRETAINRYRSILMELVSPLRDKTEPA